MKSKLYTRTGDDGTTSLVDGSRAGKDSMRVDCYGEIDEFSSTLGMITASKECPGEISGQIKEIQHAMFDIGCYLATPVKEGEKPKLVGITEATEKLEGWIDALDESTPPMKSFILPGGSEISSRCHVARTVCRRAERKLISLSKDNYVDPALLAYINRLSDYLFIVSRYLNFLLGVEEIEWHPAK